jgi:hypothetical protein
MSAFLLLLLAVQAPVSAQDLAGGGFTLASHGLAAGAPAISGSTWTLRSVLSGRTAVYPLAGGAGARLWPTPWGFTLYSHLAANTMTTSQGTVVVPKNAVGEDYDFLLNAAPMTSPLRVDAAAIAAANARVVATAGPGGAVVTSSIVELNMALESGAYQDSNLAANALVSLSYPDADGDGAVDGTNPPVRVDTLAVHVLDEARRAWVRLPGSVLDRQARTISAPTPHFSVYALVGAASTDVGSVYAFPVPWAPNSGDPKRGTASGGITFSNLPSEGTIKVYTLSGRLVRTLDIPAGLFPAQLKWDVKTGGGADVVSGVYIWRIESGSNDKSGKLMVIR